MGGMLRFRDQVASCVDLRFRELFLSPEGERGSTSMKFLYEETSPRSPNPYPFIYRFLTEKLVALSYTIHTK